MYSLVDLLKEKKEGLYYDFQLMKTVPPDYKKDFFTVEKILGQKYIRGQLHYLVKYQFYGPKFNQVNKHERNFCKLSMSKSFCYPYFFYLGHKICKIRSCLVCTSCKPYLSTYVTKYVKFRSCLVCTSCKLKNWSLKMLKSVLIRANIKEKKLVYKVLPPEEFKGQWEVAIGGVAVESASALNLNVYLSTNVVSSQRLNESYEIADYEMPLTTLNISTTANTKKMFRFSLT